LKEVKTLAGYIYGHQFWNAQIGQVEVTPERKFELVPVIGDHIIRVGNSENLEEKLNNLLVFYRQVFSKSGLNKYSILDVQYEGQVVAVKRGAVSNVDSIQLKKNIQEMLNKKIDEVQDAAAYPVVAIKDSSNKSVGQIPPVPMKTNSNPIQKQPMNTAVTTAVSTAPKKTVNTAVKPAVKKSNPVEKPKKEIRKPKAVMKKQGTR
jgi:cell division protein FtsQ